MGISDCTNVYNRIVGVLERYTSKNIADMLVNSALLRKEINKDELERQGINREFIDTLKTGIDLFFKNESDKKDCVASLCNLSVKKNENGRPVAAGNKLSNLASPPAVLPGDSLTGHAKGVYDSVVEILTDYFPKAIAVGFLNPILLHLNIDKQMLEQKNALPASLGEMLEDRLLMLIPDNGKKEKCRLRLYELLKIEDASKSGGIATVSIAVAGESDIVTARNRARSIAESLGFDRHQQIKIATAVSELSRNIVCYVGKGTIKVAVVEENSRGIEITASDEGYGIKNLEEILSGQYKSKTGLGLGIWSCKKLMDYFDIKTGPGGTTVIIRKYLRCGG